jgi:glutamine cyclotransferase
MTDVEVVDGGAYKNVYVDEEMVLSVEMDTGEVAVYDPYSASEEADRVYRPDG